MNCVYESQNIAVMDSISFRPTKGEDNIVQRSDFALYNIFSNIEIELPFMILNPTDCLSIGYFIRHACGQVRVPVCFILNLTSCLLRTTDIKALCHELCKPARKQNLHLNLMSVRLANAALEEIHHLIKSQSILFGFTVSGYMMEDLQLGLKYFIESLHSNPTTKHLSITHIMSQIPSVTFHFVLLLCSCQHLESLNLGGCIGLFKNPKALLLFCEALKHTTKLTRLYLDGCDIDDLKLQKLADVLTDHQGCYIQALDIGWNPYTSAGLKQFLETLVREAKYTALVVLSTSLVDDVHRSLVRKFNLARISYYSSYFELHIGCKNDIWATYTESVNYLYTQPQLLQRDEY